MRINEFCLGLALEIPVKYGKVSKFLSYLKGMNLPKEAYEILIPVVLLALAMAIVSYVTKRGRNFRSHRNKKARKQF